MHQIKDIAVDGEANAATVETALEGTKTRQYHVQGIEPLEVTGTKQRDAVIKVWRDTTLIQEISYKHLLEEETADPRLPDPMIPLDIDLEAGEVLEVGHVSGGTASNMRYAIHYTTSNR